MVASQQLQLNQFQTTSFTIIGLFTTLTFITGAFLIWMTSVIKQSFDPLINHIPDESKLDTETQQQDYSQSNQLLEINAKNQIKLHENQLLIDEYQRMSEELQQIFTALAEGQISVSISGEYTDKLAVLKTNINSALNHIDTVINDIKATTETSANGLLDQRIELEGKQGIFKTVSEHINQNLAMNQLLLEEINKVFQAIADGDLNQTLQHDYLGYLQQTKDHVNSSIKCLHHDISAIKDVLGMAAKGQLSERVNIPNKQSVLNELGYQINTHLDANQNMIEEVKCILEAMSAGDFSQTVQREYVGHFAQLKQDTNNSVNKLNQVMAQMHQALLNLQQGMFEHRIPSENKQGLLLDITESMNHVLETHKNVTEELKCLFLAMSTGDLTQPMRSNYEGYTTELKDNLNYTLTCLNTITTKLTHSSKTANAISSEVLQDSHNVNQHTAQQVAALENITTNMQKIVEIAKQNVSDTEQTNQLAIDTYEQIEAGKKLSNQATIAIDAISKSNQNVSQMINAIDAMAFQINTIALNAATEAARIGGQGFAKVAIDIRHLAQHSLGVAKELRPLMQDSIEKINEGSTLVEQSNNALDAIVRSAKTVNEHITGIMTTSHQQSTDISQINQSITKLDEITQQNSTLVQTLSEHSDSMKKQIISIEEQLHFFQPNTIQQQPCEQ